MTQRIIPAHTGNTTFPHQKQSVAAHHPRAHGEHTASPKSRSHVTASSPHMNGERSLSAIFFPFDVARAPQCPGCYQVDFRIASHHPRAHGESLNPDQGYVLDHASSPLSNAGDTSDTELLERTHRVIPAHTGNTSPAGETVATQTHHPHTRVGNTSWILAVSGYASSPLYAGNANHRRGASPRRARAIPAHTGNMPCGANASGPKYYASSPPSIRGTQGRRPTSFALGPRHPRTHGEYVDIRQVYPCYHASSPLYAGNTSRARVNLR